MHVSMRCKPPFGRSVVRVECSKGFGTPKQNVGKSGNRVTAKTPEQAADQALAEAAKSRPNVRPINPKEAARGKVDYVQVKDWADGKAADLGELQVVPDSYNAAYIAAGTGSGTAADAGAGQGNATLPFYQQLGRHAQYLESQGALSIALEPGAKPFLPFESWQYNMPRYRQYMAELAAVHQALETALQLALSGPVQPAAAAAAEIGTTSSSNSCQPEAAAWAVSERKPSIIAAYTALACYGSSCGLWRAKQAQADLAALQQAAAAAAADKQHDTQQQQQQPGRLDDVPASQTAAAYCKYLLQLGRSAAAATAAAAAATAAAAASNNKKQSTSRSSFADEEGKNGASAALKLVAHAYAVHVQQQCLGTRIGAAAADELGLVGPDIQATAVYMDYPQHVKEPLQQLVKVTNAAGLQLDAAGRQVVMDELPKALRKATTMLAPLATA